MKIFIVGSLNMDLVIHAPYMPENGVTLAGSGFMTNPGGKGANLAAAVGKLGGNAYMVGCVGETFGKGSKALAALPSSSWSTAITAFSSTRAPTAKSMRRQSTRLSSRLRPATT